MIFQEDHLMSMSQLIKDVIFIHSPFEQTFQRVLPDDFVYFDPPYVPKTATSFVQYTSNGFDGTQHEALFSACQELCNRQVEMLLSNSKCDYVLASFPESKFFIKVISCRRSINSKNPEEMTDEVLITNHQAKYKERL
jgi:DNA adenine methylase